MVANTEASTRVTERVIFSAQKKKHNLLSAISLQQ